MTAVDRDVQKAYRSRQEAAMINQFSGPELTDASELRSWRKIRRAAVADKLNRATGMKAWG